MPEHPIVDAQPVSAAVADAHAAYERGTMAGDRPANDCGVVAR
jgi:hypothetical protein